MELIFVVGMALIVWLYFVNATLCYIVVGGGVLSIVMLALFSKAFKARKVATRVESGEPVINLEGAVRIGTLRPETKGLVISQDPV